jgi:glycine/D-amino acid oxidase-like deaminating enzyme
VRTCIVGGGLAGSLLAWRLAQLDTGWDVDLMLGDRHGADATAASGGAVRAYETDPEQRALAIASLTELLASPTLRDWADYREIGSIYLQAPAGEADPAAGAVAEIERAVPGSADRLTGSDLAALGWADVPADATAVVERRAGHTAPGRLRDALLADGAPRRRVNLVPAQVHALELTGSETIIVSAAGRAETYDLVVLATGAWTASALRASALPAAGYRTKTIQYAVHPVDGWCPPQFVDGLTGLYGRPTGDGGLLLGLPTAAWDVDPDLPPSTAALAEAASGLAADRFPRLRLGPPAHRVSSADCYTDPPILRLRSVEDIEHRLYTFSGGSGGAVKTALAASDRAATQLVDSRPPAGLTSVGQGKGQR